MQRDRLVGLPTLLQTFEKMDANAPTSDSKAKEAEEDVDERLLLVAVSLSAVYLVRLTLKSSENSSESMAI